jgi:hypothetical protein
VSLELRQFEDTLKPSGELETPLPPANRIVYVVQGSVLIGDRDLYEDQAMLTGSAATAMRAGEAGATLWRWELVKADSDEILADGPGVGTTHKLTAAIDTLDPGDGRQWLMRCDSVSFPPGGCAFTHVHQGPGIRCLLHGNIRIDAEGQSTPYVPGEAWFEAGPDLVFAQADAKEPTRFIRCMILPRALKGQSSIRYVLDEDRDKPKTQQYQGYVDEFIDL